MNHPEFQFKSSIHPNQRKSPMFKVKTIMVETDRMEFEGTNLFFESLSELDEIMKVGRGKVTFDNDRGKHTRVPSRGSGIKRWWAQFSPEQRSEMMRRRSKKAHRRRR
jgi:hypothetical protein